LYRANTPITQRITEVEADRKYKKKRKIKLEIEVSKLTDEEILQRLPVKKICSCCGIEKLIKEFPWKMKKAGLKDSVCKKCQSEAKKEWLRDNKAVALFRRAKRRARENGLEFDISIEDVIIPKICPVLGIPIESDVENPNLANCPSIDRVDNTKGYVKGNIQVISFRANNLKSSGSIEEHRKIIEYMERHVNKNSIDNDEYPI